MSTLTLKIVDKRTLIKKGYYYYIGYRAGYSGLPVPEHLLILKWTNDLSLMKLGHMVGARDAFVDYDYLESRVICFPKITDQRPKTI